VAAAAAVVAATVAVAEAVAAIVVVEEAVVVAVEIVTAIEIETTSPLSFCTIKANSTQHGHFVQAIVAVLLIFTFV
jgi:hypothetical protein